MNSKQSSTLFIMTERQKFTPKATRETKSLSSKKAKCTWPCPIQNLGWKLKRKYSLPSVKKKWRSRHSRNCRNLNSLIIFASSLRRLRLKSKSRKNNQCSINLNNNLPLELRNSGTVDGILTGTRKTNRHFKMRARGHPSIVKNCEKEIVW